MRKTFIAGNWKMNMLPAEASAFIEELAGKLGNYSDARVMVAPPFTSIPSAADVIKGTGILLGAQNMSDEEAGAHTGEVSPLMLKDLGVDVVILGHSERRMIYGENDAFINRKVKLALKHGFEVILCVGETLEERESGKVEAVVEEQLTGGLNEISEESLASITIAYEPVWAIGTGKTATPEDADNVHAFIRKIIDKLYSSSAAEEIVIQYGGSVKPENSAELMAKENIDGALVGGASLKVDSFFGIINYAKA
ncbi:MAG: triose-phosphate isomerase [Spirochaetia bacterium]|nr:triose-phosphate isomerase [Spirochaetia bacterium]